MTQESANSAFALLSFYAKCYQQKHKVSPQINKYKEKWAASSILEDYGKEEAYKTIEYYFTTGKDGHPLNYFFNNFNDLHSARIQAEKDNELRLQRRTETARLREEWLNGNA